jgi:hypothetical protein
MLHYWKVLPENAKRKMVEILLDFAEGITVSIENKKSRLELQQEQDSGEPEPEQQEITQQLQDPLPDREEQNRQLDQKSRNSESEDQQQDQKQDQQHEEQNQQWDQQHEEQNQPQDPHPPCRSDSETELEDDGVQDAQPRYVPRHISPDVIDFGPSFIYGVYPHDAITIESQDSQT